MANPELERYIDKESLDCYLSMGFVPGERCILQGFNKLPPAQALIFDVNNGTKKIWTYWAVPEFKASLIDQPFNEIEVLDELENLLEASVNRQLVADVPFGILDLLSFR